MSLLMNKQSMGVRSTRASRSANVVVSYFPAVDVRV